jgi:hypothetical protein
VATPLALPESTASNASGAWPPWCTMNGASRPTCQRGSTYPESNSRSVLCESTTASSGRPPPRTITGSSAWSNTRPNENGRSKAGRAEGVVRPCSSRPGIRRRRWASGPSARAAGAAVASVSSVPARTGTRVRGRFRGREHAAHIRRGRRRRRDARAASRDSDAVIYAHRGRSPIPTPLHARPPGDARPRHCGLRRPRNAPHRADRDDRRDRAGRRAALLARRPARPPAPGRGLVGALQRRVPLRRGVAADEHAAHRGAVPIGGLPRGARARHRGAPRTATTRST